MITPPEEDEGERFEHELNILERAAADMVAIHSGDIVRNVEDAHSEFVAAARPDLIAWLFEDRQRQADEYDKAWRRDLCDKNNVQVLAAEVAKLRQIISECATACGAAVSVECSIEFMALLPGEIRLAVGNRGERGKPLRNAPGHNHLIPGMWDNKDSRSRMACSVCAAWSKTQ